MTASAKSPPFISSTILLICAFPPPFSPLATDAPPEAAGDAPAVTSMYSAYILASIVPPRPRRSDRVCKYFLRRVAFFHLHDILSPYKCAQLGGGRCEQSGKKQHFVRPCRAGTHCACHVASICQPAFFTRPILQLSAQRDLCAFVQRVVLLPLASHRADAGAALSAGDLGADGAVDRSALDQIFH